MSIKPAVTMLLCLIFIPTSFSCEGRWFCCYSKSNTKINFSEIAASNPDSLYDIYGPDIKRAPEQRIKLDDEDNTTLIIATLAATAMKRYNVSVDIIQNIARTIHPKMPGAGFVKCQNDVCAVISVKPDGNLEVESIYLK